MNNLYFWLGFFAGFTIAIVVLLFWIRGFKGKDHEKRQDEILDYNERSLAALNRRNQIDEGIAESLRALADKHGA